MSGAAKTAVVVPCTLLIMIGGFLLLRANLMGQLLTTLVAVIWGVASVVLLFYSLNLLAQNLPSKAYNKIVPYIFIGPAILIMGWYLLIPTIRSLYLSFLDKNSTHFVDFLHPL